MCITLGLKSDHRWNIRHWLWHFYLRLFHMFISQSVKLISDNIWIGLVLWHRLDVYNKKISIHNKCTWVGINFDSRRIVFFYTLLNNKNTQFIINKQYCPKKITSWWTMQQLKNINKTDKHIHTHKKRYLEVISRSTRFKEFNRKKKTATKTSNMFKIVPRIRTWF